jgi:acetyl esterase/lipase
MTHRSPLASSRRLAIALACALSLAAAGCGGSSDDTKTPAAGDLVSFGLVDGASGVTNNALKLRYRMPAVTGGLTEANALLFTRRGSPPEGGWPVVAWAHGTTGVADGCAPSKDYQNNGDAAVIQALLDAGFAVIAPDYEGLDAPGVHPYYNRNSHAQSMLQAVKAAQDVPLLTLSKRWAVLGHSQGGHAALATAQSASELGNGFDLRATVAIAPGSDLAASSDITFALIDELAAAGNLEGAAQVLTSINYLGAMFALGLQAAETSFDPNVLLGSQLAKLLDGARTDSNCFQFGPSLENDLRAHFAAGGSFANYGGIKRDWYKTPGLQAKLDANAVGRVKWPSPTLVIQGTDDFVVPFAVTSALIDSMQALGTPVTRVDVKGGGHNDVVLGQLPEAIAFIQSRMTP